MANIHDQFRYERLAKLRVLWILLRIASFRDVLATEIGECRALVDVLVASANGANLAHLVDRIQAMKPSD